MTFKEKLIKKLGGHTKEEYRKARIDDLQMQFDCRVRGGNTILIGVRYAQQFPFIVDMFNKEMVKEVNRTKQSFKVNDLNFKVVSINDLNKVRGFNTNGYFFYE